MIYLAIPYSWNPQESFRIVNKVTAGLMQKGIVVFNPISHSHPISEHLPEDLRFNQQFWMDQDLPILEKCSEVCFIIINSKIGMQLIEDSLGCQSEKRRALELGIKITYQLYYE